MPNIETLIPSAFTHHSFILQSAMHQDLNSRRRGNLIVKEEHSPDGSSKGKIICRKEGSTAIVVYEQGMPIAGIYVNFDQNKFAYFDKGEIK